MKQKQTSGNIYKRFIEETGQILRFAAWKFDKEKKKW
jgi:hypothetical protein